MKNRLEKSNHMTTPKKKIKITSYEGGIEFVK